MLWHKRDLISSICKVFQTLVYLDLLFMSEQIHNPKKTKVTHCVFSDKLYFFFKYEDLFGLIILYLQKTLFLFLKFL